MEQQNLSTKKELYSALVKAVNELENPLSTMDNPYFKSKYVPLADILDLAKPVLKKYGLAVIQTPYVMYEVVQMMGKNNQLYNQEIGVVKVTTSIIHESGELIEFPPMVFKASGNTPQAIGSAITYGRRYSISSILGIAGKEEDDDGNVATIHPNNGQAQSNNHPQQPSKNVPSNQQQPTQQSQSKAVSNIDLRTIVATVKSKTEGVSGKGTPYMELMLESNGKSFSAIAKDEAPLKQAKSINQGQEATFKILTTEDFNFVKSIQLQGASVE